MKSNLTLPDFDKMTWKCNVCEKDRPCKFMKFYSHEISDLLVVPISVHINVRYCVDMPQCKEKASNFEWVANKFFKKFIPDHGENK